MELIISAELHDKEVIKYQLQIEKFKKRDIIFSLGGSIVVTTNNEFAEKCSAEILWVDYKNITNVLNVGSIIYIDDGLISLKVMKKESDRLECYIVNGGNLGSKKVICVFCGIAV